MFIQDFDGHQYLFSLQKLQSKTCITGDAWQRFISDFKMEVGEMVLFEMTNKSNAPMRSTTYDADFKVKERIYVDDTSSDDSEDLEEGCFLIKVLHPFSFYVQSHMIFSLCQCTTSTMLLS
jgi:hypothetical protein